MIKFKLDSYKDFKIYFNLFDVLIKNKASNKELFLESIYISPSSYRRAKNDGNKIGEQILIELCQNFGYNLCCETVVDEIEEQMNKIYFDLYYKNYQNYSNYISWVENMMDKNYILFPIFKLIKLILIINNPKSPNNIVFENQSLYDEIKLYSSFYTSEINELVEILDVTFKKNIDEVFLSKNYSNDITYHTLAARCTVMKRYLESIYFCNVAKERFIKDENYKRVIYINLILLANYNSLFKFKDAYELEQKQMFTLSASNNSDTEYKLTMKHHIVTLLGLKKYSEILKILNTAESLSLTETACVLIANYKMNKNNYNILFNELIKTHNKDLIINFLNLLNNVLELKDKKLIEQLNKYDINKCVIEILKECLLV